ncbi:MAG: hypothetical protein LBN21_04535 [Treponema sp.]|jgi:hypothetical protein|nr:hypothetical protein [Treponema sp.]
MRHIFTRRTAARLIFIIGLLSMFLGSAFLLASLTEKSSAPVLLSFLFVLAGVGGAVLAIKLNKRSLYLFFAALFLQIGLFLLLKALDIIQLPLSRVWPVISVFAGIALFPSGWHRYGAIRSRYLVPSIAFVVLGSVMLIFSFKLVSFSFAQFIKDWWAVLVVLAGLTLVLISLGTKNNTGDVKQ